MSHNTVQNLMKSSKGIAIIVAGLLLPLIMVGVYVVQSRNSRASGSCAPENIHSERASQSLARISFDTTCTVKASVYCSVGREGVQFLCGQDQTETTKHLIETSEVTLSSDTPYFIYIDTGLESRTLGYIQANPVDSTVGLDFEDFDENVTGLTSDEKGYDISLDINQDGIVNGMDRSEFYPEYKK